MEGLKSEEGSSKRRKGNDEQSISDVSTHQDIAQHEQAASASAPAPAPESSAAANDTGTALLQKLVKAAQESGDHNTGVTPTQMIIQQAIAALPDTPSGDVVPMLGQQHHQADPSSEPPSGLPALPQPASMASFVQSSLHWVYNISTPETFDSNGQPLNRRKRRRTTDEEQAALEAAYRLDPQMPPAEREKLANTLNMPAKSVQIWFQNRRQTAKKNRDGTWDGLGKWQRTPYKVVGNYKVVGPEHVATPTPTKNNDPIDHAGVVDAVHALIGLSQGSSQEEVKSVTGESSAGDADPGHNNSPEHNNAADPSGGESGSSSRRNLRRNVHRVAAEAVKQIKKYPGKGKKKAEVAPTDPEEPAAAPHEERTLQSQSPPLLPDPAIDVVPPPTTTTPTQSEEASTAEKVASQPQADASTPAESNKSAAAPAAEVGKSPQVPPSLIPNKSFITPAANTPKSANVEGGPSPAATLLELPAGLPARLSTTTSLSQTSEFFNFTSYVADLDAESSAVDDPPAARANHAR